jgi:quinoprotein glucose dehydrogenase
MRPGSGGLLAATSLLSLAACAAAPPNAADYETWDAYLGGPESSQYSSLDEIDRGNVSRLEIAWTYDAGVGVSPLFNPIVVGGVLYAVVKGDTIVALDAATGEEIWRRVHDDQVGSRGINIWTSPDGSERRLVYLNGGFVRELDAATGEPIADFGVDGAVDLRIGLEDGVPGGDLSDLRPLHHANPGRIFENLYIIALPAGEFSFDSSPGDVHAYDILSGDLVWEFHTIPRPGEPGRETWPDDPTALWGGGHSWSEATVDVDRGAVYIPTGAARYDHYGANRVGDNLYANSVVALDARTGRRLWHFQAVHHDLWDYDLPTAPRLVAIEHDGRRVDALAQPTKHGFLFVLDRETGEPIWPVEERPVPASDVPGEVASPTQPFPTLPPPYARQSFTEADINPYLPPGDQAALRDMLTRVRSEGVFTPPSIQGSVNVPGVRGGATWGGAAADPDAGLVYVVASNLPTLLTLSPPEPGEEEPAPGAPEGFVGYRIPMDYLIQSNGLPAIAPPWSTITAYDLNEGRILWQVPNGGVDQVSGPDYPDAGAMTTRGGPAVTAGGLLFVATASDRKFRARDVADGSVLWEHDLPSASEGVPAVYEAAGREFVVIPVGGAGQFTYGLDLPPPGPNQYVAFALPE